jgi:hypothetical protein
MVLCREKRCCAGTTDASHDPRRHGREGGEDVRTVWKYPLSFGINHIELPVEATILHVAIQHTGQPAMWAEVDTDNSRERRHFMIFGTGDEIPESAHYIGTVLLGQFVWHVIEVSP